MRLLRSAAIAAGLLLAGASTAEPRSDVVPYLEVQQVLTADLNGGGDVLTYTALAAGVDATVETRSVQAQASYRYERRIAWEDDLVDEDIHTGLAQARVQVVPGSVVMEAGALAARARGDAGAPILGFSTSDDPGVSEVYSAYMGPSVSTQAGPLTVNAAYRLSYVKVDDQGLAGLPPVPGAERDRYNSATGHLATVSVGMDPGELPVGWTVGAGYAREDVDRLDQSYEGKYVRADGVVPVSPTFAVTGGIGYEDIAIKQDDILRDSNGIPLVTPGGNLVADPSAPRILTYDQDGLIWDVGVIWRPTRRTELQARFGERYGGTTVTASLEHRFRSDWGVSVLVYDSVDSFGRLLVTNLQGVPVDFDMRRNPLFNNVGGIGGCVFGGEAGSGVCFDDALQTISSRNFRNRGATILFSGSRGPWGFNFGGGYANRRYIEPVGFALNRVTDESITLQAGASRALSPTSELNFDAYAAWYDSDRLLDASAFGSGITGSYTRRFLLDRLEAQAALGLFHADSNNSDATTAASALLGLRYSF